MGKFESKNTILTKKLNNIIYELLVKTSSDMVYTDSSTTLTETLSDITRNKGYAIAFKNLSKIYYDFDRV